MKNGFTPKQYAYALAADALYHAERNSRGQLDDLPPAEREKAIEQMRLLRFALQDEAHLDSHV